MTAAKDRDARVAELRRAIREAREELRSLGATRPQVTRADQRRRREALLHDLRENGLTLAEAAARHGYAVSTVYAIARRAGVLIRGTSGHPCRPSRVDPLALVARYRDGETLESIGRSMSPPITREWVRQIIAEWERKTGERLPRKNVGPKVNRVYWCCEVCGRCRNFLPSQARRVGARCATCKALSVERQQQIEGWIAARRAGQPFSTIARGAGIAENAAHRVTGAIYHYLIVTRQQPVISELWPRGVPPYLLRRYPTERYEHLREAA